MTGNEAMPVSAAPTAIDVHELHRRIEADQLPVLDVRQPAAAHTPAAAAEPATEAR